MSKFKVRELLSPHIGEPCGLATLSNGHVLVTDTEKACVHIFDDSGKYCGKFGDVIDLKCPSGSM